MYKFGYFRHGSGGIPGGGGSLPPALTPKVSQSEIENAERAAILVLWNEPMKPLIGGADAFSVIVNGAAPIKPTDLIFNKQDTSMMGIMMATPFKLGDVVTWAYNDQHPTITLESLKGKEADNQTYGVVNNIEAGTTVSADNAILSVDTDTITIDKE